MDFSQFSSYFFFSFKLSSKLKELGWEGEKVRWSLSYINRSADKYLNPNYY